MWHESNWWGQPACLAATVPMSPDDDSIFSAMNGQAAFPASGLFVSREIERQRGDQRVSITDEIAVEEPLEMQVVFGPAEAREVKTISITMRTPGHDRELAVGFLVGEGLLRSVDQLESVTSRGPRFGESGFQNSVQVALWPGVALDLKRLERNCYTTSSCGVCGKTSMEALKLNFFPDLAPAEGELSAEIIGTLPERLREAQEIFDRTGGLHAAGLFTPGGQAIAAREDVGRHNAVDKVIGSQFLDGRASLSGTILVVSGRASFELMQKALAAGIPILVAVGAPSSLAVQVAERFGATLIGFTKPSGFNIYSGSGRVRMDAAQASCR